MLLRHFCDILTFLIYIYIFIFKFNMFVKSFCDIFNNKH